jgi:hypothetical protein
MSYLNRKLHPGMILCLKFTPLDVHKAKNLAPGCSYVENQYFECYLKQESSTSKSNRLLDIS